MASVEQRSALLFSVIVPVYNVAPYIRASLDSLAAEMENDMEVLLIDDGSTDDSGAICDEYAQKDSRFQVIHQQNAGVSATRNVGLAHAKGQYLLWLDPDDWVLPGWYTAIRQCIETTKADLILFDYQEARDTQMNHHTWGQPAGPVDRRLVMTELSRDHDLTSVLWNKAMHRRLFEGLTFPEELSCMEDYAIMPHLVLAAEKIVYLPKPLYVYRIREEGLVRTPNLTVGYRCYQEAQKRLKKLKAMQVPCSVLGVLLQAKGFCCKYYQAGMPEQFLSEYKECRGSLLRSGLTVLRDRKLPLKDKLKYLLIPYKPVGRLYARKKQADIR